MLRGVRPSKLCFNAFTRPTPPALVPYSQAKAAVFSSAVEKKSVSLIALDTRLDGLDEKLDAIEAAVTGLPGSEVAAAALEAVKEQVRGGGGARRKGDRRTLAAQS